MHNVMEYTTRLLAFARKLAHIMSCQESQHHTLTSFASLRWFRYSRRDRIPATLNPIIASRAALGRGTTVGLL